MKMWIVVVTPYWDEWSKTLKAFKSKEEALTWEYGVATKFLIDEKYGNDIDSLLMV